MNNPSVNKSGYSVIIALFMVGFLLVLTTGILSLVLRELKDNKGRESYLKAYYGAEAGQELALLKIKEKGYGYYDKINHDKNNLSIILSTNPTNINKFKWNKDVFISYDLNYKTNSYTGSLSPLGYDIIPLFFLKGNSDIPSEDSINNLQISISSGIQGDLVWNIVSKTSGISGIGNISSSTKGKGRNNGGYFEKYVVDFLSTNSGNYMILFNSNKSDNIKYNINTTSGKFFTKPKTEIISSAQIGNYRQNLKTTLDNTQYLNILKYSIYSK